MDRAALAPDSGTHPPPLGDAADPPPEDAEPLPGDVCGRGDGLDPSSPWPLLGGCPTRAGWSALGGPQAAAVAWTLPVAVADTSPAIEGSGVVWVGTAGGDVLAVTSSRIRAGYHTGGAVRSSVALDADGNAVVVGGDGVLYGLRVSGPVDAGVDGGDAGLAFPVANVTFSIPVGPAASSPVIGPDGTIYVGTLDGKLAAVAARGTSTKWAVMTNDTSGSSPAIGQDGTIFVGSSDHKLYAFTPDGAPVWALDLGAEVVGGSPSVGGDGTIYIGTGDGKLHAVNATGTERWSYSTGGPITTTPAVYAAVVYVGSADKKLHAVSVVDGAERWTYETLGAVGTPVIAPDNTVYVGSADGHLYAVTPKGSLYFAINLKGKVKGAPAIAAGPTLYVTTDTGLVAVGP